MATSYSTVSFAAYKVDISNKAAVYAAAQRVAEDIGNVSILINNAGIVTAKPLLDAPDERIIATMNVNSVAHFWTIKAFLPFMIEQNHGHIVTIASSAGTLGVAGLCDYCASKFAAVGIDESLRFELRKRRLTGARLSLSLSLFPETLIASNFAVQSSALLGCNL